MKSVTKAEQEDIFSLLEAVETSSRAFLCFSRISSKLSSDIQRRDFFALSISCALHFSMMDIAAAISLMILSLSASERFTADAL